MRRQQKRKITFRWSSLKVFFCVLFVLLCAGNLLFLWYHSVSQDVREKLKDARDTFQREKFIIIYHASRSLFHPMSDFVRGTIEQMRKIGIAYIVFHTREQNRLQNIEAKMFTKENIIDAIDDSNTLTYVWIHYQHDPNYDEESHIFDFIPQLKAYHVDRIITTIHHDQNGPLMPTPQSLFAHRKIWSLSDQVILPTEMSLEALKVNHAIPEHKLSYIPYGLSELDLSVHNDRKRKDDESITVISYVCRDRFTENLLPALRQLISFSRTDTRSVQFLVIVCREDSALVQEWNAKAREIGISPLIKFEVDSDEQQRILTADIFIHLPLTSPHDVDPILLRAMLSRKPLISIDYGYAREIMYRHKSTTYLVPHDQYKLLTAVIANMIEMPLDKRLKLGRKHYDLLMGLQSWSVVFSKYLKLIRMNENQRIGPTRLMCVPEFPHTMPRTRIAYINFGYIETFDGSRVHLTEAPKEAIYNLLSDPILQINGAIERREGLFYLNAVGILWYDQTAALQELSVDTAGNIKSSSQISSQTTHNDDGSITTQITIQVAQERYQVRIAMHRHSEGPSWIDIMILLTSELVAPTGIIGRGAKEVHRIGNELPSWNLDVSIWDSYMVGDGVLGTSFKNNMFIINTPVLTLEEPTCLPSLEAWRQIESNTSVWWHGPQLIFSGIATVNRELCLRIIEDTAVRLSITRRDGEGFISANEDPRFYALVSRLVNESTFNPSNSIVVRSGWPVILMPTTEGGTWIMTAPWEFGVIPIDWAKNATDPDNGPTQVWIPSRYVKQCYTRAGVPEEKIVVIPHGVIPSYFKTTKKSREDDMFPSAKKFRFLFRGGMLARKGIDILLRSYLSTFKSTDDVTLIIHGTYENYFVANVKRAVTTPEKDAPHVIYTDRIFTIEESNKLYRYVDCFVAPYRSEGFGLPILEAMAAQIPVIVTEYGPSLEFCNRDNSYMIKAEEEDCQIWPCSGKTVFNYQLTSHPKWARPDSDDLKRLLRHVFENKEEAAQKALVARRFVQSFWTWERASHILIRQLRKVILLDKDRKKRKK